MRIAFICSSLEPGCDGVGDYTRRLAGVLIRQGHEVAVVALNDAFISGVQESEQEADGTRVHVLRFSRELDWSIRVERARAWVDAYRPDWISIQFVCFGFHLKGLPFGLGGRLKRIAGSTPVHWMFHELWVGFWADAGIKLRLWGDLQRRLMLRCHRQLSPLVTHTTNDRYVDLLAQNGVPAGLLPLFSNIPVCPPCGWTAEELHRLGIDLSERKDWVLLGLFGSIQPQWSTDQWMDHLLAGAERQGRRVALLGIGRLTEAGRRRFDAVAKKHEGRLFVHHFGPESPERISDFLQTVDAGVSTVERSLAGKSGSVAAYREHALSVLFGRTDDRPDRSRAMEETLAAIDRVLDLRAGAILKGGRSFGVEKVAAQLFNTLASVVD